MRIQDPANDAKELGLGQNKVEKRINTFPDHKATLHAYSRSSPGITGPALIAVFFLKLKQQSCINMFELLLIIIIITEKTKETKIFI